MFALKAEYGVRTAVRWHIVPDGDGNSALCQRLLSPIAAKRALFGPEEGIPTGQLCERCHAVFENGSRAADDTSLDPSESD